MDQQTPPPRGGPGGASVRDYRRGIEDKNGQKQWQKLWHFNENCENYPTRNFIVQKDRPSDDELCSRCHRAAGG